MLIMMSIVKASTVQVTSVQATSSEAIGRQEIEELLDRAAIADVIQRERAARDAADWEEMAAFHHPDSWVDVAWFKGSGADFVEATRRNWRTDAINFHEMGTAAVTVNKDRAVAETACTLHGFYKLDGIDVTSTGFVRLLWRALRLDGRWLIAGLRSLYVRDLLQPCAPTDGLNLDEPQLAGYRLSYRYLTHTLKVLGRQPKDDLPGIDRPESVAALEEAERCWLYDS